MDFLAKVIAELESAALLIAVASGLALLGVLFWVLICG